MKNLLNLKGAHQLDKNEQQKIKGGFDYIPCKGTNCQGCPTQRFCNGSYCVPCRYDTDNRPCCIAP